MTDIVGKIVSVVLIFVMLVITPIAYVSCTQWTRSRTVALVSMRSLIDEVIDTREMSDQALADFNLSLAGASESYKATITREVKVVDPDPLNPGKTVTSYVVVDNNRTYNQGDYIIIRVETLGMNTFQTIMLSLLGMDLPNDDEVLAGRVR